MKFKEFLIEQNEDRTELKKLEDRLDAARASYARREVTVGGNQEKKDIDALEVKVNALNKKLGIKNKPARKERDYSDFYHTINKPTDFTLKDLKKAFERTGFKVNEHSNYFSVSGLKTENAKLVSGLKNLKISNAKLEKLVGPRTNKYASVRTSV